MRTNNRRKRRAETLVAALLCLSLANVVSAADAAVVASQTLREPAASTKIATAIWTRRSDRYTLQIVFPKPGALIVVDDKGELLAPHATSPSVTVWLLRADGTTIPTKSEAPLRGPANSPLPAEIAYSVSLAAGGEAVAAAVRIDDEYYVERLTSLDGKQ